MISQLLFLKFETHLSLRHFLIFFVLFEMLQVVQVDHRVHLLVQQAIFLAVERPVNPIVRLNWPFLGRKARHRRLLRKRDVRMGLGVACGAEGIQGGSSGL